MPQVEVGVSTIIEINLGGGILIDFGAAPMLMEVIMQGPKGDPGVTSVEDAINSGVTDKAPSEDAVYEALLSKIEGDGTNKISVSTTPPSSPSDGDIWFVKP